MFPGQTNLQHTEWLKSIQKAMGKGGFATFVSITSSLEGPRSLLDHSHSTRFDMNHCRGSDDAQSPWSGDPRSQLGAQPVDVAQDS